jgi:hypothetical protein
MGVVCIVGIPFTGAGLTIYFYFDSLLISGLQRRCPMSELSLFVAWQIFWLQKSSRGRGIA